MRRLIPMYKTMCYQSKTVNKTAVENSQHTIVAIAESQTCPWSYVMVKWQTQLDLGQLPQKLARFLRVDNVIIQSKSGFDILGVLDTLGSKFPSNFPLILLVIVASPLPVITNMYSRITYWKRVSGIPVRAFNWYEINQFWILMILNDRYVLCFVLTCDLLS